jgi:sulfite exporter TauE/SafE
MNPDVVIIGTAFVLGLLGSLHCAGMCGGIVGLLHQSRKVSPDSSLKGAILTSLAFNGGRILSYMIAGALASLLGFSLIGLIGMKAGMSIMQLVAGFFMILLGLYVTGIWNGLTAVERLGQVLWKNLGPLLQKLLPVTNYTQAIKVGAVWGWLPCGLVYSALVLVMASGNPLTGALAMGAFGLGTLPMLSAIGVMSQRVNFAAKPLVRKIAGAVIVVFGFLLFTSPLLIL